MKIANVWVKHCYIAEYLPQVHHFSRQNSQTVHVNDEDSSRFFFKASFPQWHIHHEPLPFPTAIHHRLPVHWPRPSRGSFARGLKSWTLHLAKKASNHLKMVVEPRIFIGYWLGGYPVVSENVGFEKQLAIPRFIWLGLWAFERRMLIILGT